MVRSVDTRQYVSVIVNYVCACVCIHEGGSRLTWTMFTKRRIIKSRRMRWAGHVERMGEMRNAYRILVGKPEGKKPLGRPRRR
jgi:hypothetical protein